MVIMKMMSASKFLSFPTMLLFVVFSFFKLSSCAGNRCPDIEKQALLSFKQSLHNDLKNSFSSWSHDNEVNCCEWNGVQCSNLTGHVQQLSLQMSFLTGTVSPSLLNLKYLKYLDLSGNNFNEPIPPFIGSLTRLEYLNLSFANFYGNIPRNIGNLSNLHTLSLEEFSPLEVDSLEWMAKLSKLEYLNMNGVDLSRASEWVQQVINKLPSLVELRLRDCNLDFTSPLSDVDYNNITSSNLAHLDLSGLSWRDHWRTSPGILPRWIFRLSNLTYLDLSHNKLFGPLTLKFGEFKNLRSLDLSNNSLSGVIPSNLGNLSSLEDLDLGHNKFIGNLPESIGQLSNLQSLSIDYNMLEGIVNETHFSNLSGLRVLVASGNNLTLKVNPNWIPPFKISTLRLGSWNLGSPIIPPWLDTQNRSIQDLDLSNTGIYGNVPSWAWRMRFLNLSHNNLHGQIIPVIKFDFVVLQIISRFFYLGSNKFSGELLRPGKWVINLDLSNNSLSGNLSHFLCKSSNRRLENLQLEGNQLTGELPNCFNQWPSLRTLNLGNNNFSGAIPFSIGFLIFLKSLNLHGNNFSGDIPLSMQNCTKLFKIDLSRNNLSGNLPEQIVIRLSKLVILLLKSNKLSGEITSSICRLRRLQILDLSDNNFVGMIPRCVNNFTAMTNKRRPSIPSYSKFKEVFLEYASIFTKGKELTYDITLLLVKSIDLSNNNLSGDIPKEITSLVELRTLNLFGNHLTGMIPLSIGNMTQLESLDLSINSLSGELPNSFRIMSSLNYLNVSYNKLTGRIPKSTQFCSFNESSFIGNNLSGPPLTGSCSSTYNVGKVPVTKHMLDGEGDKPEIEWLYVLISLGYAVGLSGFLTTIFLKRSWREAYFESIENVWDSAYVYVHIIWNKLKGAFQCA